MCKACPWLSKEVYKLKATERSVKCFEVIFYYYGL